MTHVSRLLNTFRKRVAAAAIIALAIGLPIAVSAAQTVSISADTGVANVTSGATTYSPSTNATNGEVVKVSIAYTNDEPAGSAKDATNVKFKINVPTAAGSKQVFTTSVAGDNTNTVNGSATVNLDQATSYLEYIPGTAEANVTELDGTIVHEISSTTPSLENLVTTGYAINEGNPCQSAGVAIEARVVTPNVAVNKYVREAGTKTWATSITANPGDTLNYEIEYQNDGTTPEDNVVIRDSLPAAMTFVSGSTILENGSYPNGTPLGTASGTITNQGVDIGDYAPGANAYIEITVKAPVAAQLTCGDNLFRNVGVAHPEGMNEYYNTADVHITGACTPPVTTIPTYQCTDLHLTTSGLTATIDQFTQSSSNGATFKDVSVDWDDGSSPLLTNTAIGQSHVYATYGKYTIVATTHFTVNGADVPASTDNCTYVVTFTAPGTPIATTTTPAPTSLVNTGPGQVIGLFAGVSIASAFAYRLYLSRKLAR